MSESCPVTHYGNRDSPVSNTPTEIPIPAAPGIGLSMLDSTAPTYIEMHNYYPTTFASDATVANPIIHFPTWPNKLKVLVGTSLAGLANVAAAADAAGLAYDALAYNLETSGVPWEYTNVYDAMVLAQAIAATYGVEFMPAIGGALYDSWDLAHPGSDPEGIAAIGALADYWFLPAQRQEIYAAGSTEFLYEVAIRLWKPWSGNTALQGHFIIQLTTWGGRLIEEVELNDYCQAAVLIQSPPYDLDLHSIVLADYNRDPAPPTIVNNTCGLYYGMAPCP